MIKTSDFFYNFFHYKQLKPVNLTIYIKCCIEAEECLTICYYSREDVQAGGVHGTRVCVNPLVPSGPLG